MFNKIIITLIYFYSISNCFAGTEFPVNFLLQADITPLAAGFKIESVAVLPNKLTVRYEEGDERFRDINAQLVIDTNIPKDRTGSFYYDINLVDNEASCILNNGNIINYESPTLAITNNVGDFVNITNENPIVWQKFSDTISETKASIRDVNISFSKIPLLDFMNSYKSCNGKMTLMVGLSI